MSDEEGHPQRWVILAVVCLCLVLVVAGVSSLNLAIPSIIDALNPTSTQTLWIVDGYALVFAGLLLPAGALGDRFGRKGALLIGLTILIACALWASQAGSPNELIVARAMMGVGAALIMPATLSIIIAVFPLAERPKAIAVWAGFAGGGAAIGIIAGGFLLEAFWWGSVMLINVPLGLLAMATIAVIVPTSRDEGETPLDPVGSVLSILGLSALVFAIIEGGDAGWTKPVTLVSFVVAAAFLIGWQLWERHTADPMLDPELFTRRTFNIGSITLICAFGVMFGMFFVITQFFQFVQGHSPLAAGVRNLPFAGSMIVVSPQAPAVAARLGKRGAMVCGLVLMTIGFAGFSRIVASTPYWQIAVAMVVMASGMALLMPPASEAIVSSVPPSRAGVGSAWNDTTREVGAALGLAVIGSFLAMGYRNSVDDVTGSLPAEAADAVEEGIGGAFQVAAQSGAPEIAAAARDAFVDGLQLSYTVAAVVCAAMAVLVLSRYPNKANEPEPVADPPTPAGARS